MAHVSDEELALRVPQMQFRLQAAVVHVPFRKTITNENDALPLCRRGNGLGARDGAPLWHGHLGVRRIFRRRVHGLREESKGHSGKRCD
jgi:hypothetical protein